MGVRFLGKANNQAANEMRFKCNGDREIVRAWIIAIALNIFLLCGKGTSTDSRVRNAEMFNYAVSPVPFKLKTGSHFSAGPFG
jgi:hypothetical protein